MAIRPANQFQIHCKRMWPRGGEPSTAARPRPSCHRRAPALLLRPCLDRTRRSNTRPANLLTPELLKLQSTRTPLTEFPSTWTGQHKTNGRCRRRRRRCRRRDTSTCRAPRRSFRRHRRGKRTPRACGGPSANRLRHRSEQRCRTGQTAPQPTPAGPRLPSTRRHLRGCCAGTRRRRPPLLLRRPGWPHPWRRPRRRRRTIPMRGGGRRPSGGCGRWARPPALSPAPIPPLPLPTSLSLSLSLSLSHTHTHTHTHARTHARTHLGAGGSQVAGGGGGGGGVRGGRVV